MTLGELHIDFICDSKVATGLLEGTFSRDILENDIETMKSILRAFWRFSDEILGEVVIPEDFNAAYRICGALVTRYKPTSEDPYAHGSHLCLIWFKPPGENTLESLEKQIENIDWNSEAINFDF